MKSDSFDGVLRVQLGRDLYSHVFVVVADDAELGRKQNNTCPC